MERVNNLIRGAQTEISSLMLLPNEIITYTNAYLEWHIKDEMGKILATDYAANISINSNLVNITAFITVPSSTPVAGLGTPYILVWELDIDTVKYYQSEIFTVLPEYPPQLGPTDKVGLGTSQIAISCAITDNIPNLEVKVYKTNNLIKSYSVSQISFSNGVGNHTLTIPPKELKESLIPYILTWEYNSTIESSRLYVTNPSLLSASSEMMDSLNRIHTYLGVEEAMYQIEDLMSFLKTGADHFNTVGQLTDFTMMNATGAIYSSWLVCSQIVALRSQYMVESLKSFDFNSSSVTLSVDLTSYLESQASVLENWVSSYTIPLKKELARKGVRGGDGNLVGVGTHKGAVGITLGPLTRLYHRRPPPYF